MELMDVFGIIFIALTALCCLAASFYIYVYFAQPQEKEFKGVWWVRGLIVVSLATIFFAVFLLPMDMIAQYEE